MAASGSRTSPGGVVVASAAAASLIGAIAAGCGALPAAPEAPAVTAVYDPDTGKLSELRADGDRNGTVDTRVFMDGTRVIRAEIDRDEDGLVERWEHYGPAGDIDAVAMASAGDGVPDTWFHRGTDGTVARVVRSRRRDGRVLRTEIYAGGRLSRAEEDSNGDGRVDRWEEYADGALVSAWFADEDAEGQTVRLEYGPDGEIARITRSERDAGASR